MGVRHSLQNSLDANVSGEKRTIRVDRILNLFSAPPKAGLSTCNIQHAIRTGHVFGLLNISGSGSGPAVWSIEKWPKVVGASEKSESDMGDRIESAFNISFWAKVKNFKSDYAVVYISRKGHRR